MVSSENIITIPYAMGKVMLNVHFLHKAIVWGYF